MPPICPPFALYLILILPSLLPLYLARILPLLFSPICLNCSLCYPLFCSPIVPLSHPYPTLILPLLYPYFALIVPPIYPLFVPYFASYFAALFVPLFRPYPAHSVRPMLSLSFTLPLQLVFVFAPLLFLPLRLQ